MLQDRTPSWRELKRAIALLAPALIIGADLSRRGRGAWPLGLHGLLDEAAHLATGALALQAFGHRRGGPRFAPALLLASVAIDADHVPACLGRDRLTRGTSRPYPHSLPTLIGLGALAGVSRVKRDCAAGVFWGTTLHLWRDFSEAGEGIPLLWPLSRRSISVGYVWYATTITVLAVIAAARVPRPPAAPPESVDPARL